MKKKFLGRVLTMLLVASMVFTLLPAPAIAAGNWWWNNDEYTEEAVPTATTDNSNFMRIFHLDCGRKYFSVDEVKGIIDQLAANNYTHIELAFGNEGLRFVPDASRMAVGEYEGQAVVNAIATGNQNYDKDQYLNYTVDSWTESDMNLIFAHAEVMGIKIIPMLDIPGHMNAVIYAMQELGIDVSVFSQVNAKGPGNIGQSFDTTNTAAVAFAKGLVDNYINYFAEKKCEYFNIAGDECGFGSMSAQQYDAYIGLMNELNTSIKDAGMTTMMFNDGVYYKGNNFNSYAQKLDRDIVICYWTGGGNYSDSTELAALGFKLINTNVHWYYVAGNDDGSGMFYYDYAIDSLKTRKCTKCDGGGATADTGCMLAYWCDNPTASVNTTNLNTYIKTLADNNPDYFKSTAAPEKPGTKLEKTINVTVGGDYELKLDGNVEVVTDSSYNSSIATYTRTTKTEPTTTETPVTSPVGKSFYIKNMSGTTGTMYLGDGASWQSDVSNAKKWICRDYSYFGSTYYYLELDGASQKTYLRCLDGGQWSVTTSSSNRTLFNFDSTSTTFKTAVNWWETSYTLGTPVEVKTDSTPKTIVTFKGLAKGDTYVTIGNVHYTIHVTEEDLSKAKALPIQLWITSQTIAVDQDGMKSKSTSGKFNGATAEYLSISATPELNTTEGVLLSQCVPESIKQHYEEGGKWYTTPKTGKQPFDFMLWKGTVLKSGNIQTVWGTSCINKGTDFAYVRYLGGKWQVSNDRSEWTTVTCAGSTLNSDYCEEQLVAYYYMQTKLTDDVTTNIVDWGDPYESQTATDYVLLDFAVKTETGEATPAISSFPMEGRTLYYHCKKDSDACGTDSNNNRYRRIDQIEARNTGEYEIYMITLTPTADSAATKLASTCNGNAAGSDIYKGTEKVVWVKDADTLQKTEFADENLWYTSPSENTKFDSTDTRYVGGKAELSNVEIYNKQGLLVTYYVRSTAEHKVFVHYIDNRTQTPFHTVEISVPTDTTYFDPAFGMSGGKLIHNTVQGVNHTETVQSDLQQLPLVSAQYRRANYTLIDANLGGNTTEAKDAYLYYDFSNAESFVVDFGLPLTITPKDVGNLGTATITNTKISYNGGLADISATTDGTITYKLNKPLGKTADSFSVTYTGPSLSGTETKGDVDVTFTIYIYPASNVLYEENFLTEAPASNGLSWKQGTPAELGSQETQKAKADGNVFGYDAAYVGNSTNPVTGELGAWTATGLEVNKRTTSALTTDFYGNGFDLIGNCGPSTGRVILFVKNAETGKGKLIDVDTRYSGGDLYQVPLAHVMMDKEASYNVTIYAAGLKATNETPASYNLSGAATYASDYAVGGYDTVLSDILAENGLTMADVEYVKVESAPAATTRSAASFYALDTAAETGTITHAAGKHVEIDGFRVYRSSTNNTNYPKSEQDVQYLNILDAVSNFTAFVEGSTADSKWEARDKYENAGGPQNEIYLRKTDGENSAIAFKIDPNAIVQISARAVENEKAAELVVNGVKTVIATNTEMYYTFAASENGIVTIKNTGKGMLALGNLKIKKGTQAAALSEEDYPAAIALLSLNAAPETPDEGFNPAINAKVTTTRFIRSKVVTLMVSASADVEKLMVNGVELRPTNSWLVKMGWSDTYTYILTEKVQKSETKTYEIVGYRADGAASETIVVKSK